MELIKIVDYEDTIHYLNKEYIIAVRPFPYLGTDDDRKSKIEYGTGFVDCIYMKESASEVAGKIAGAYFARGIQ